MEIEIGNNTFPIQIIRKNNKNIYFRFKDNTLSITCNRFISENEIKRLIIKNQDSLIKMYKKVKIKENNNLYFHYLGKQTTIVYDEKLTMTTIEDNIIYTKNEK